MKKLLAQINRLFENRIRLGIMSALSVNERLDFKSLKELLGTTDGNLASNIGVLERNGLVNVRKRFVRRRPNTSYSLTPSGRRAFQQHLETLEALIRDVAEAREE